MFSMNKVGLQKRARILGMLVGGNSLRAVSRMADCSINTVTRLLVDVGTACAEYQDAYLRNLTCKQIQCDEIWAFCGMREKNVPEEHKGELGYDVYTWTALDRDTKLIASFLVGRRDYEYAEAFIGDLADRLVNRVRLTTDGHRAYLSAVEEALGADIDFAQLVKIYGPVPTNEQRRYSPAGFVGAGETVVAGNPDMGKVSTSHVERQSLTMSMGMCRFARLTNGFSKKVENLAHAVAIHFMYYNFGRIHKSLRVTPAMEAGIADHVWTLAEIAGLVKEEPPKKRGPYKKRI